MVEHAWDSLQSRRGGQPIEARLKSVFPKNGGHTFVVDRRVRVQPVGPWIDVEIEDLREVRSLEQHLAARQEIAEPIEFHLVQLKQLGVLSPVERGVRQEELGR